jgi:hypothetical protein
VTTFENLPPAEAYARRVSKTQGTAHVLENPLNHPHPFAVAQTPSAPQYPLLAATYQEGHKTR